jgi:hypothetical protein
MSEVQKVTVQIAAPGRRYPAGAVAFGYYTLANGVVTLTDPNGKPAGLETGKKFSRKLEGNEDARAVACKMTKELRLALRDKRPVNGFDGPLHYPPLKF